jgi:hypothetical protein
MWEGGTITESQKILLKYNPAVKIDPENPTEDMERLIFFNKTATNSSILQ